MHTVVNTPVENVEVVVATKATKPKKLSAKYEKFLVFGYWFVEQLKQQNIEVDESVLHQQLTMFSSVDEQTQYFEAFFEQLKTSTKSMKAIVKEHNKPPAKAKKTKKEPADKPTAAKKSNGRKKKTAEVINDKQEELVAELVAAAQTEELPVVNDDKPKPKYSRKPKAKPVTEETTQEPIAVEPEAAAEVVLETVIEAIKEPLADKPKKKTTKKESEPKETKPKETKPKEETKAKETKAKETKPKETKAKKTKKAEEPVKETFVEPSPIVEQQQEDEEDEDDEDDEAEIEVQKFEHKGLHYLRDYNNNNIYDHNTCELIGIYDPSTDAIALN
jgi:hypothetical protein